MFRPRVVGREGVGRRRREQEREFKVWRVDGGKSFPISIIMESFFEEGGSWKIRAPIRAYVPECQYLHQWIGDAWRWAGDEWRWGIWGRTCAAREIGS